MNQEAANDENKVLAKMAVPALAWSASAVEDVVRPVEVWELRAERCCADRQC